MHVKHSSGLFSRLYWHCLLLTVQVPGPARVLENVFIFYREIPLRYDVTMHMFPRPVIF